MQEISIGQVVSSPLRSLGNPHRPAANCRTCWWSGTRSSWLPPRGPHDDRGAPSDIPRRAHRREASFPEGKVRRERAYDEADWENHEQGWIGWLKMAAVLGATRLFAFLLSKSILMAACRWFAFGRRGNCGDSAEAPPRI